MLRYDGNVYEALYGAAKMNPLNSTDKMVSACLHVYGPVC